MFLFALPIYKYFCCLLDLNFKLIPATCSVSTLTAVTTTAPGIHPQPETGPETVIREIRTARARGRAGTGVKQRTTIFVPPSDCVIIWIATIWSYVEG